jgi:hypothetical protein
MKEAKQKKFIINQLLLKGQVSRNTCLKNYISRLGAFMCDLKEQGLKYEAGYTENRKDYVYKIKGQKRLLKTLLNR